VVRALDSVTAAACTESDDFEWALLLSGDPPASALYRRWPPTFRRCTSEFMEALFNGGKEHH
jgi:hypothetical protein